MFCMRLFCMWCMEFNLPSMLAHRSSLNSHQCKSVSLRFPILCALRLHTCCQVMLQFSGVNSLNMITGIGESDDYLLKTCMSKLNYTCCALYMHADICTTLSAGLGLHPYTNVGPQIFRFLILNIQV